MDRDIAEKRLENCNDVFADIFDNLVFDGEHVLDEEQLASLPTESFSRKISGGVRQGNRDIRKMNGKNGAYRLICGLENQSGRDNTMPQRIMGYDFAAYEEQIKELIEENRKAGNPAYGKRIHDHQKLIPVVTAVLYYGTEGWEHPMCLHDMLEFPEDMKDSVKARVANYPMNLIYVAQLPKETRNRLKSDFRLIAEFCACKGKREKIGELMEENQQKILHPEEFFDTLSAVTGDKRYREVYVYMKEREKLEEGLKMCEFMDYMENKGMEKGMEKGIKALIQTCSEFQNPRAEVTEKLMQKFQLSRDGAEEYMEKYWQK